MPYKEKPIVKQYYSISEAEEIVGVPKSTLRFWEKKFPKLNPKKNKKGNRLYSLKDLEYLKLVQYLVKERRFTIDGAKQQLSNNREQAKKDAEIVGKLNSIKSFLLELKEQL